jgi:hypothetical protein
MHCFNAEHRAILSSAAAFERFASVLEQDGAPAHDQVAAR